MAKIKLLIWILIWMHIIQIMVIQNVCIKVSAIKFPINRDWLIVATIEVRLSDLFDDPYFLLYSLACTAIQFLVRAKTTADKIVILLWTWPSRSAADNSIRNKILSYRAVIEDDEDEEEDDSEEDYDFDLD